MRRGIAVLTLDDQDPALDKSNCNGTVAQHVEEWVWMVEELDGGTKKSCVWIEGSGSYEELLTGGNLETFGL